MTCSLVPSSSKAAASRLRWTMLLLPCVVLALAPPFPLEKCRSLRRLSGPRTRISASPFSTKHVRRSRRFSTYAISAESSSTSSASSSGPIPSSSSSSSSTSPSKLRLLKDKMWFRETQQDLTAAEFATSLDARSGDAARKRKRAVDYENLLSQLDVRVLELCCDDKEECDVVIDDNYNVALVPSEKGMGSIVYSMEQRDALLKRILQTRQNLVETMKGHDPDLEVKEDLPFGIELPEIRVDIPKEADAAGGDESLLYLRDDGTVDWDGALQDRAALRKFGISVWARINGMDPEEVDEASIESKTDGFSEGGKAVTAKIEETETIRAEKERLDTLVAEYKEMEEEHTKLLNSAISAGQAVANINLATLDPGLRSKIRQSSASLDKMKEEVSFQTLIYELERIYTYLDGEMTATGPIPLQDRLNVAEFGLLESQIESLNEPLEAGERVDPDVLAVVLEQVGDLKRRLGIDYYVTGLTYDREAIQRWLNELWEKTKKGFAFYVKGCRLFWNDIVFGFTLVGRALRGYTLKPREVRNLRRTVKDIFTFIPVVIILLIPLSPVGHVLVFGAIQRFFPGFFPSCFTESRQNLLQLYESTEYSEVTINETWQEKLSRFFEAFAFLIANSARKLYTRFAGKDDDGNVDDSRTSG